MYNFPFRFSPAGMNYGRCSGGYQGRGPVSDSPQRRQEAVYQAAPPVCCQKNAVHSGVSRSKLPVLKCSAAGDIILPKDTKQGATYNIAAINLDTSNQCSFLAGLDFSCNICITEASLHLRFQLFKQGLCAMKPIPVGPGFHYSREAKSTESNTIAFSVCDYDSSKSPHLNYSVYVEVMGGETEGTAAITNSILIAALTEI